MHSKGYVRSSRLEHIKGESLHFFCQFFWKCKREFFIISRLNHFLKSLKLSKNTFGEVSEALEEFNV